MEKSRIAENACRALAPNSVCPLPPPIMRPLAPTPTHCVAPALCAGTGKKYFLLGGKGGVGKTSCSAALAVRWEAKVCCRVFYYHTNKMDGGVTRRSKQS